MKDFVSGATFAAFWIAALFFARFWVKTQDRFFAFFAAAFVMFGAERVVQLFIDPNHEARSLVYLIRLGAFLIILFAVIDKNRAARSR